MKRYKVESVRALGGDRFETHLLTPENHRTVLNERRVGATLAEMEARAEKIVKRMNPLYTEEKWDNKDAPYRKTNKAMVEQRMRNRDKYGNGPAGKRDLNELAKFIAREGK